MLDQLPLMPAPAAGADPTSAARREAYCERLRAYLQDPAFRAIEGFPIADDDAIMALSDPPTYTACPNPFLPEILEEWRMTNDELRMTDSESAIRHSPFVIHNSYHREPFAADVSEGKNDPIYNAHSYHTKVPHKAIMRYILHYTEPGDVVFDGFCGTGMTGVAAQLCGDRKAVEELGYVVDDDGNISQKSQVESQKSDVKGQTPFSRLGARKAVLVDLSPAATFIAYNYNTPVDVDAFEREATRILREVEDECGWMYETWHPHCDDPHRVKGKIRYTVWSEVFLCPQCSGEVVFLDEALDPETQRVKDSFPCPHCGAEMSKRALDKCRVKVYDAVLGKTIETLKRKPVLIEYQVGRNRCTKRPDAADLELLEKIEALPFPTDFPSSELPYMHMTHQRMRIANYGVTYLHHFFFPRPRNLLYALWTKSKTIPDSRLRTMLLFTVEQTIWGMSLLNRYGPTHFSQVNRYLSGVYYVSSLISEVSPWYILEGKVARLGKAFAGLRHVPNSIAISTQSVSAHTLPAESVDYIFTDPPFGENIYYADLNYLVESWHGVKTDSGPEAIVDQAKHKTLRDYQDLMRAAFRTYYRALKSGHWMTVEFHNSHSAVWNAIQEALLSAGFVVADVRTLDKQASSYRQVTAASAAKQDLVISAYKPNDGLEERFRLEAGSPAGAWDFVRQHLARLPIVVLRPPSPSGRGAGGEVETLAERQPFLLFDRMVAFHIQRGAAVPLSAAGFYQGLRERFVERDGMIFLPDQVPAYDRARLEARSVAQLTFFVSDEKSALQWLKQQLDPALGGTPQTYQQLQPQFLKQLHQAKHESLPELGDLLEQNFLPDEAGAWRAPDPAHAADLEALRRRALLREFVAYLGETRRLRQFRTEAVRAGFADAWQRKDYAAIIAVAERLPEAVLQEDPELLMYYDNATLRVK